MRINTTYRCGNLEIAFAAYIQDSSTLLSCILSSIALSNGDEDLDALSVQSILVVVYYFWALCLGFLAQSMCLSTHWGTAGPNPRGYPGS